ncbi:MAG: FtsL-like putative cell division protein [Bacteroidota bacterium]
MENEIKKRALEEEQTQEQPTEEKETVSPKKPSKILSASEYSFFLDRENLRKLFPMIFFLAGLGLFYIYNAHYAQRIVRKTDDIKDEIKELRAEYITIKSDLMYQSKQSQVSKRLEGGELKELRTPPYKITFTDKDER